MSLAQEQISGTLYEEDKWGTKAEYKRKHPHVSFAAMAREIDRGKISVQLDIIDRKIKMNFRQADIIFGFVDLFKSA
jgi:hypothetical protein